MKLILLNAGGISLAATSIVIVCALAACRTQPRVSAPAKEAAGTDELVPFPTNNRILFQGDSITDGNRGRSMDPNHILGHGYAFIIAALHGGRYPERNLIFLNRGCSGHKVSDLQARWQHETIDLKPDVLSILIGINDYNSGVSAADYAAQYERLLAETVKSLPGTKLILCEPFGLQVGHFKEGWDKHRAALEERQAIVARLALKYSAVTVHFQRVFDEACRRAPADYWMWDGVHPTYSGHQLMAEEWIRAVKAASAK